MQKIIIDGEEYMKKTDGKKVVVVSDQSDNPFMEIGDCYFIRTVTHYFTGRLIWVGDKEIVLRMCVGSQTQGGLMSLLLAKLLMNLNRSRKAKASSLGEVPSLTWLNMI